jgi:hypothetical protein
MVNELLLGRIFRENPSSIPDGNNFMPNFFNLAAELWIIDISKLTKKHESIVVVKNI